MADRYPQGLILIIISIYLERVVRPVAGHKAHIIQAQLQTEMDGLVPAT